MRPESDQGPHDAGGSLLATTIPLACYSEYIAVGGWGASESFMQMFHDLTSIFEGSL